MVNTISLSDASAIALSAPTLKSTSLDGQLESSVELWVSPDGRCETGVWECTAGTFTATRDGYDEVCVVVSGHGTVTDSEGVVTDLTPGSTLITPAGWTGTWVLHETLRKIYTIRTITD